jgi:hypothetical protein
MTHTSISPRIQTSITSTDGRIALIEGDEELGYLTFRVTPTGIALAEHTFVRPEHEGKGYAGLLAKAFFELCAERGLRVRPICSYIKAYIHRHPELESFLEG